jgi:hypothetical protein
MLMSFAFAVPWVDILTVAGSVTLLEGAVYGRGTTKGRKWPVASWLRPIFAIVGLILLSFGLIDFALKSLRVK